MKGGGAITTNVANLIVKNNKIIFSQNVKMIPPDCP